MRPGDKVITDSIKRFFYNDKVKGWGTYKAPKGEKFVLILLGSLPDNAAAQVSVTDMLNVFGWTASANKKTILAAVRRVVKLRDEVSKEQEAEDVRKKSPRTKKVGRKKDTRKNRR